MEFNRWASIATTHTSVKMLKFLSKNPYNAVALEKIKRKGADNHGEYERVAELRKKLKASQTTSANYEPLQKLQTLERQHSACQLKTMLANQAAKLELKVSIKDIINEIVEVALVSGVDLVIGGEFMETLVSPSEEHLPKISDLRKDIHGKKNCSVDHEFRSWFERAKIIYFCLHSKLGNGDKQITANTFGISDSTLRTWMKDKRYYS